MSTTEKITTETIAEFKNGMGSTRLAKVANAFVVSFYPVYGETVSRVHNQRKKAEIDFSFYKHTLMRGEGI